MIRPLGALAVICIVLLGVFQSCGSSVRLSRQYSVQQVPVSPKEVGQFCGPDSVDVYVPQNVVMIIDMSASNTSRFQERTPDFSYLGGVPHWYYHLGPGAYQDCVDKVGAANCVPPTDSDTAGVGRRFIALTNYLRNCPQNQEPTNRYGVIGFSTSILRAPGFASRSCEDQLQNRQNAENEIMGFSQLQQSEVGAGVVIAPAYPFKEDETSYRSALNCMDDRIRNDLNPDSVQRSYKVLFLTDGKPSDKIKVEWVFGRGYITTPLWQEYGDKLNTVKTSLAAEGFNFVFQPIYYGLPAEQAEAVGNLDRMAMTVSAGITTLVLDPNSSDFTTSLADSFCKTPAEKLKVGYESWGGVQVIPLTSIQIGDALLPDQDMDGVPDDEEAAAGFSPTLSHSRHLLDSLCLRYRTACDAFEAAYTPTVCDPSVPYGFGFNDCDRKFMDSKIIQVQAAFGRTPFTGLDDDGDGVLSYFEFTKGTDPLVPDLDGDPDLDGVSTRAEILQGTDPFSSTNAEVRAKYQHTLTFNPTSGCASGVGYRMSINAMPVIDLGPLSETRLTAHNANENVFALIYYAKPVAYSTKLVKVYLRYLKVMNDPSQTTVIGTQISLGDVRLP